MCKFTMKVHAIMKEIMTFINITVLIVGNKVERTAIQIQSVIIKVSKPAGQAAQVG